MTPEDVLRRLAGIPDETFEDVKWRSESILKEEVYLASSGPFPQSTLTAMGHPYSRRNPRPPMHPGIVNVQTGRFREAWEYESRIVDGDLLVSAVNRSDRAEWLSEGTRLMIDRPMADYVSPLVHTRVWQAVDEALGDILP